jgi:ligand-binding sensor domain-containing protein
MSDYIRDQWGVEDGFPGGPVYAIAQTPDGYLWIGTEKGLVRFDGINFRLFNHTNSTALLDGAIQDLMTDADGNLWIRPQSRNLLRYRNGIFQDAMPGLDNMRYGITAMCRGPKGEALFAVRGTGIFLFNKGKFEQLLSTEELSTFLVISMAKTQAQSGNERVWMGTRDAGLFFMSQGQLTQVTTGLPDKKINSLMAANDGELWIGTDNGVVKWNGAEIIKPTPDEALSHAQALAIAPDRESNIWIGTNMGLLRLNSGGVSPLEDGNRQSIGAVNAIFEDREGNLWIGSTRGIDRLRSTPFISYSVSSGRPTQVGGAFYIDDNDYTWFAPSQGGLFWRKGEQTGEVKIAELDRDIVYSLTGGNGELWIGRQRGGLTHLHYKGNSFTAETYTKAEGLTQNSIYTVYQSRDGSVWAGSISAGLNRLKNGKVTTFTVTDGLASNMVTSILETSDGTMWFGTSNGLNRLSQNNWSIYRSVDGLPPGTVNSLFEDASGAIWIGTDNGLAVFQSGRIRMILQMPQSLYEPIRGMVQDKGGALWVSTMNHVLRVESSMLLGGEISDSGVREFGLADGLHSTEAVKRPLTVIMDKVGRIWFSTNRGLSVVDSRQFTIPSVPAIAKIEEVTADGGPVDLRGAVSIPGARQRITFSYTGLSLSVPERVMFRYKLDGYDQDWSQPVKVREATYTNLSPRQYHFRVIACNSDGLWNGPESIVAFEIQPVFWQKLWFQLAVLAVIILAALCFYRYRVHLVTRQLNVRFEERLAERTRIAEDLHDTLLQGILSASMQLDVANDKVPENSPAKPLVVRVLGLMRRVVDEGRKAVSGLRTESSNSNLEYAFSQAPQEMGLEPQIDFRVIVEGEPRPLHPIIRDEVYHIGREALVNAFRHSQAKSVEIEISYLEKYFKVAVRDDGRGIDEQILQSGREGHWGLSGMRGRAERIGARLNIWNRKTGGAEITLSVPGAVAFQSRPSRRLSRWLPGFRFRNSAINTTKTDAN